ncbi:alpha/beta hydrolase family protein [Halomonas maura]|uniref:alpha/beta hydrolase family protein n=1 Tax=Halomonas maura TaxID=117606 RepID=UPI0025B4A0F5|nr:acyl-CoA thioester hydrolase/BAAT C-terminal domain-containing protein [Halomonas maura]MDN3556723.1 acyl-CoA thioester hydrolase/BAAT C-terminal domain-containing protein [Halomonas maura]
MLKIVRRLLPEFGTTYGPAGDGPFPGILILHGSEGGYSGWSHRLAVLFAAHGFLAYPHAYSRGGNAWNAGAIEEVPLDRTADALSALREFPPCSGRVGLYGLSRGGEHALLLASLMAREGQAGQADALAAHAPADVICGSFDARSFRDSGDPGWQAWDAASRAWSWRGSSEGLKPTTPIEIERYSGPVFLSHGVEDATWSVAMTRRLSARLGERRGHIETHLYEGEGHLLRSEAENLHHERLLRFFTRCLGQGGEA